MSDREFPLEVKRIIERVRLNMPSPEALIRECRRKIYYLDHHVYVDIYSPTFETDMKDFKKAREALLRVIRDCRQEIRGKKKCDA